MRISDWSSDVCSSDLHEADGDPGEHHERVAEDRLACEHRDDLRHDAEAGQHEDVDLRVAEDPEEALPQQRIGALGHVEEVGVEEAVERSEEHTSELQSLMRISYAVFCLKKKNKEADKRKTTYIQ